MANGKTTEKGKYRRVRASIDKLDAVTVDVGYFAGTPSNGSDDRFLMPDVASIQEFGSHPSSTRPKIPERSFMRSTFDKFQRFYTRQYLKQGYRSVLGKIAPEKAMASVGEQYRSDLIVKITGLRQPPNAPSTIAAKNNNNPLIWSGLMKNSIKVKVFKRAI